MYACNITMPLPMIRIYIIVHMIRTRRSADTNGDHGGDKSSLSATPHLKKSLTWVINVS